MKRFALLSGIFILAVVTMSLSPGTRPAMADTAPVSLHADFAPVLAAAGTVRSILPLENGQILVVGRFTSINGTACRGIARLNVDGSVDQGFNLAADIEIDEILCVARQADGKLLIGGNLSCLDEDKARIQNHLLRLNTDGSRDTDFDAGGYDIDAKQLYGLDNLVRAVGVDVQGRILAGGDFSNPHARITRLTTSGAVDATFQPGNGADGPVTHIGLQSDGHIIIGGTFSRVAAAAKNGVARLTATGALDTVAFGSGIYGGSLQALAIEDNDRVLLGGDFDGVNGQAARVLARCAADGTLDTAYTPFVRGYLHAVTHLMALDSHVVVGGWDPVMYFDGEPTDHNATVYTLSRSDGGYVAYFPYRGENTDVLALAQRTDGRVVVGGSFVQADTIGDNGFYPGLCLLGGEFFQPQPGFRPLVGDQAQVRTLARQADGKILVGGAFSWVNGDFRAGIARLGADGSTDPSFVMRDDDFSPPADPAAAAGWGSVRAVACCSDGKILAGGSFRDSAGNGYAYLGYLNTDGTVGSKADINVRDLVQQPDGKILAICPLSPGIKRLNTDLTPDGGFNPGSGISNVQQPDFEFDRANCLARQADGKILVAGSFAAFSGQAANNIVRLNDDGSLDLSFVAPAFEVFNSRHEIFAVAVQADGKILVGGRFSKAGGADTPSIARLNPDGSLDAGFRSPFGDQGLAVHAIAVQDDGRIWVGGTIQKWDATTVRNCLFRLDSDGVLDDSFNGSLNGMSGQDVQVLLPAPGGILLAGGGFDVADGRPRFSLAQYNLPLPGLDQVLAVLQFLAGSLPPAQFETLDIDGDGRTGVAEAAYWLQKIGLVR